jgi:hypothetical protein
MNDVGKLSFGQDLFKSQNPYTLELCPVSYRPELDWTPIPSKTLGK